MRVTIDKVGRLVIPKQLRDSVGLRMGEVDVTVDGSGLRIEPVTTDALVESEGRLLIGASGAELDDELVRQLRDAGRR